MDFHWSHPILIGIVVVMFVTSFTYAGHVEPFLDRLQILSELISSFPPTTETLSNPYSREPFANFKKCETRAPRGILKDVFDSYEIYRTRGEDWDIFLPCSYTHVEQELQQFPDGPVQASLIPTHPSNGQQRKAIFAVDGCDELVSKNSIWKSMVDMYGREHACSLMPPTYIISDTTDQKRFLEEYTPDSMYICKKNIQQKKGLMMTNNLDTLLRSHHQGFKVVQKYITDVHTVKQHKLNLRLYVLVVCEPGGGPKRVYVHSNGKCMYTAKPYNPDTPFDQTSQITSLDTSAELYEGTDGLPLTFDELRNHWESEEGVEYEQVMANIHRVLREVVGAAMPKMCRADKFRNHVRFQLFGADVLLCSGTLNPFVLELNKGPSMAPTNQSDYAVKRKVLEDVFQIVGLTGHISRKDNSPSFIEL